MRNPKIYKIKFYPYPEYKPLRMQSILMKSEDGKYKSGKYLGKLRGGQPINKCFFGWHKYNSDKHSYEQVKVIAWAEIPIE